MKQASNMPDKTGTPAILSRRSLLKAGTGSVVLYSFHLPLAQGSPAVFTPNGFIRVAGNGQITLVMPQVEMGQGVYTSISMILAEELDADFAHLTLEHAPPDQKLYGNPMLVIQATG